VSFRRLRSGVLAGLPFVLGRIRIVLKESGSTCFAARGVGSFAVGSFEG
jgi:hypothetical protein